MADYGYLNNYIGDDLSDPLVNDLKIKLDQKDLDYAPGETATITIKKVTRGATAEIQVLHVDDPGDDGEYASEDDKIDNNLNNSSSGQDVWYITDGGEGDLDGVVNGHIVIEVTKTGSAAVTVGEDALYTITIANTSSADTPDLVNALVMDSLLGNLLDPTNEFVTSFTGDTNNDLIRTLLRL